MEQTQYEKNVRKLAEQIAERSYRLWQKQMSHGRKLRRVAFKDFLARDRWVQSCMKDAKEAIAYAAEMFQAGYNKGREDTQDMMKGDHRMSFSESMEEEMIKLGLITAPELTDTPNVEQPSNAVPVSQDKEVWRCYGGEITGNGKCTNQCGICEKQQSENATGVSGEK